MSESRDQNSEARKQAVWNKEPLPGVGRVIAIASGKGGVGKSTLTVLLAHAMAAQGRQTGILDADIYGPSIPRMLGLSGKPEINAENKMVPLRAHGVLCNSMGFLLDEAQAAVWRGPMITKALYQLARMTQWSEASNQKPDRLQDTTFCLLVDMPPGTGDIHLSMVQQVPVDGAVLVTTPQEVAVQDAIKCADMFAKVNIPILGVIENMSWLETPSGERMEIFGAGGGGRLAEKCGAPLLAKIPLLPELTKLLDKGGKPAAEMLGYVPMV